MTLFVTGSSVTRFTKHKGIKTYTELLRGKLLNEFQGGTHNMLYTVLTAEYETRNLKLKKKDVIVFNFGINDCIYRKDKRVQLKVLNMLCARASELDEPDMLKHFQTIRTKIEKKKKNE